MSRKYFQLINNIALVAVLFSLLVPTISQVLIADGGLRPLAVEICSTDGTKRIEASVIGAKAENQAPIPSQRNVRLHAGHCATCCAGQNSILLSLAMDTNLFLIEVNARQALALHTPSIVSVLFHSANPAQAPHQFVKNLIS